MSQGCTSGNCSGCILCSVCSVPELTLPMEGTCEVLSSRFTSLEAARYSTIDTYESASHLCGTRTRRHGHLSACAVRAQRLLLIRSFRNLVYVPLGIAADASTMSDLAGHRFSPIRRIGDRFAQSSMVPSDSSPFGDVAVGLLYSSFHCT